MDYLTYYGLNEEPFRITPDAGCFFASRSHHNALLSLGYSTDHREGFCLVTGEPGAGKTTLLNVFLEQYRDKAEIAMVLTPRLSPGEFLMAMLEDLGVQCASANKNEVIRTFRDFLIQKSLEGRAVIILVDEAQNLPDETLEELRLLSNLETEKEKLLHIILVGQPELAARLRSPQLRQLDQRIITRMNIDPLDIKEVGDYISFRLTKAGRGHVRFRDAAIRRIDQYSKGIPRLINTITTRTLMSAFLEEAGEIEPKHVQYAVQSLKLEEKRRIRKPLARPVFAAGLALAVVFYFVSTGWVRSYAGRIVPDVHAESIVQTIKASHVNTARSDEQPVQVEAEAIEPSPADTARPDERPAQMKVEEITESHPKVNHPVPSPEAGKQESGEDARGGIFSPASAPPNEIQNHADQNRADPMSAMIISHSANVRETPGLNGEKIAYVQQGENVRLRNETADVDGILWRRVDLDDGNSGWISSKVLRLTSGE